MRSPRIAAASPAVTIGSAVEITLAGAAPRQRMPASRAAIGITVDTSASAPATSHPLPPMASGTPPVAAPTPPKASAQPVQTRAASGRGPRPASAFSDART
jgi:hypothetical protein